MKTRAFWRSFAISMITFCSLALLIIGIFTAYVGTRKIGFDSHTTILEWCDLYTIRFMDWYVQTDFFADVLHLILKYIPAG